MWSVRYVKSLISKTCIHKAMPNRNSVKSVRVGFRVLSQIKKHKFVGEIFLYNSDVPGFRKKHNYTFTKTININLLPSTYWCE